jgi:integrating conjugative element protein (TIGR03757 family)
MIFLLRKKSGYYSENFSALTVSNTTVECAYRLTREIPRLLTTLILCGSAFMAMAAPVVTVFTTAEFPVSGFSKANARIVYVDAVQRLNQVLAAGMPHEQIAAKAFVLDRINSPDGAGYFNRLKPAIEDLVTAWAWGVKALPAVVIDNGGRRYVVYGTTDSAVALNVWELSRGVTR